MTPQLYYKFPDLHDLKSVLRCLNAVNVVERLMCGRSESWVDSPYDSSFIVTALRPTLDLTSSAMQCVLG